jgi:hypothetical protein
MALEIGPRCTEEELELLDVVEVRTSLSTGSEMGPKRLRS